MTAPDPLDPAAAPRCTQCGREYAQTMTVRTTTLCPDCLTRSLDPAAVEAAAEALADRLVDPSFGPTHFQLKMRERERAQVAITAYFQHQRDRREIPDDACEECQEVAHAYRDALAEARASLERAVEARENANALSIRLEGERDRAVERAEAAEADLAVCRAALEKIEDHLTNFGLSDLSAVKRSLVVTREALSRLAHSSEEER